MNAYDQMMYLLRIPFILLIFLLLAVMIQLSQPSLSDVEADDFLGEGINAVRADLYAGIVAHHEALYARPGVIDAAQFTQATANKQLVHETDTVHRFGIRAQLLTREYEEVTTPIYYNQPAWTTLRPLREAARVQTLHKQLPVSYEQAGERHAGILNITIHYER